MNKKKVVPIVIFTLLLTLTLTAGQASQAKSKNKEAEAFFEKCKTNLMMGDGAKAAENAEKAISLDDSVSDYYLCLGDAYVLKISKLSVMEKFQLSGKIKEAYEAAVKLDGKSIGARSRLASYYYDAPVSLGGSIIKAKEQAAEILKLNPLMGQIFFSLIYLKVNDLENGEKSVEAAYKLQLEFKKKQPRGNSGFSLKLLTDYGYKFIVLKKYDKAIKVLTMSVDLFPGNCDAYDCLAEAYWLNGNKEQAVRCCEKSLEVNPTKSEYEKQIYQRTLRRLENIKKNSEVSKKNGSPVKKNDPQK